MSVVHTDEGEMESDGKEKKQRSSKEEVDPILQYPIRFYACSHVDISRLSL